MMLSHTAKGYAAAIMTMLIIGFSFLLVKVSLEYATPLQSLTHRFIAAFIGILPIAVWKRHELRFARSDIPMLALMALLYPILAFGLQVMGLKYITSAEAGIIQAVQPLITMTVAFLILLEIITIKQRLFALLSVSGVVFIFIMQGIGEAGGVVGYLLLLLSVIVISTYSVLVRKFKSRFTVLQLTFFCITTGAAFFTLLSIGSFAFSDDSPTTFLRPLLSTDYLMAILYLGILSSLVTLALTNYSYARVEASKLGVFGNLVPIVAIFAGIIIMNDSLSWVHILGTVVIFTGVIGVNIQKKDKTKWADDK